MCIRMCETGFGGVSVLERKQESERTCVQGRERDQGRPRLLLPFTPKVANWQIWL